MVSETRPAGVDDVEIPHGIPSAAFNGATPTPIQTPSDPTDVIHVDQPDKSVDQELPEALDADTILQSEDEVTEWVNVPEWHMRVLVRSLQGYERDAYEASLWIGNPGNPQERQLNLRNARAKLAVLSMIHPVTKKRLFRDDQVVALTRKNAAALDKVATVAQYLSGLRDRDLQRAMGNSEGDLNVDSTSESP